MQGTCICAGISRSPKEGFFNGFDGMSGIGGVNMHAGYIMIDGMT